MLLASLAVGFGILESVERHFEAFRGVARHDFLTSATNEMHAMISKRYGERSSFGDAFSEGRLQEILACLALAFFFFFLMGGEEKVTPDVRCSLRCFKSNGVPLRYVLTSR